MIKQLLKGLQKKTSGIKPELKRDFSFQEWDALSYEEKRDVWNQYWSQYNRELGRKTRNEIVSEFRKQYPKLSEAAIDIGIGWFGFGVCCLFIVLQNSKIKVPRDFSDIRINKGVVLEQKEDDTFKVQWREVGGKSIFTKNSL